MLNFHFSEKGQGLVSSPHFVYYISIKIILMLYLITDQISLADSLYFSRYWAISVLKLFANQAVTP